MAHSAPANHKSGILHLIVMIVMILAVGPVLGMIFG